MMKFPSRNNKRRRRMQIVVGGSLIAIALLAGIVYGMRASFGRGLAGAGTPIWKTTNGIRTFLADSIALLQSKKTLYAKAEDLLKENAILKAEVQDRDILAEENMKLQELFNRKPEKKEFIYASILARPGFFAYDSLIVGAGERDGVEAGELVYAGEYSTIGVVSEVYSAASRVTLFSNPGQETEILIGESSTTPGIALGKGAGNFEIKLPSAITIKEHEPIRLANDSHIILGEVTTIKTDPADSFQKVLFTLPVNIQELSSVLIQKNGSTKP
jgi:cell shape-determining protein MreC